MSKVKFITLIGFFSIFSCTLNMSKNGQTVYESMVKVDTSRTDTASNYTASNNTDSDGAANDGTDKVYTDSTLGCTQFITNPLPEKWAVVPYWKYEHNEKGEIINLNKYDKVYYDAMDCFNNLNEKNNNIKLPSIKLKIEFLSDNMNLCSCGATNFPTPKMANYQLPDIGPYQVYYTFQLGSGPQKCHWYCSRLGSLILVNPDSAYAKQLPIYFGAGTQSSVTSRFFYIENNKIKIWQYETDEDSTELMFRREISIMQNGEIVEQDF